MRSPSRTVLLACALLPLLAGSRPSALRAHDPGLSLLTLRRSAAGAELQWVVNDADLPPPTAANGQRCSADAALSVWLDGRPAPIRVRCYAHDDRHTAFEAALVLLDASELRLALPLLAELPRGHRGWARAFDRQGRPLTEALLSRERDSFVVSLGAPGWTGFAWLGAQCTLGRLDQLLLGLLLIAAGRGARGRLAALGGACLGCALGLGLGLAGPLQPLQSRVALTDGLVIAALVGAVAAHALPRLHYAVWPACGVGLGLTLGLRSASMLQELGVASLSAAALPRVSQFGLGVALALVALASLGAACSVPLLVVGQGLRARVLRVYQRRIRT